MGKLIRFIPLILFIALGAILFRGVSLNPTELPSALIGKKFPEFALTSVLSESQIMTTADFKPGIKLVNVWGTWCPSCRYEHEYLNKLSKTNRFTIYGLNYDDQREDAAQWLTKLGNPYQFSAFDEEGKLSVNLGVYAAPETFVVDHSNTIRKRYAGPLTPEIWQSEFEPLITQIEADFLASTRHKGNQ